MKRRGWWTRFSLPGHRGMTDDEIALAVLELCERLVAESQGRELDRIGRSPLHDEVFGKPQEAA